MKTVKIALLGFGVVGSGVYETLMMNQSSIEGKTGIRLEVARILTREPQVAIEAGVSAHLIANNIDEILEDPEISVVVEVIGGIEPASSWMLAAMAQGKHVVTANKAAVAANYQVLVDSSKQNHVMLRFEASVAGGIPILDALQAPLNSNDIEELAGIVNGTTNFILTQMTENNLGYTEALKIAQDKGFAEADPTADVEGIDSANKLSILIALAFGEIVSMDDLPRVGISSLTAEEIRIADGLGYKIKLLATAKKVSNQLQAAVSPVLIPKRHMLASVSDEFNAIFVRGNAVGDLLFYGKGAGSLPTASAVAGDIIEIANAIDKGAAFDTYINQIQKSGLDFDGEGYNQYLVRFEVKNQVGVLGNIATVFGQHGVGIEKIEQFAASANDSKAMIIFVLHETERTKLDVTLAEILQKEFALAVVNLMRVL